MEKNLAIEQQITLKYLCRIFTKEYQNLLTRPLPFHSESLKTRQQFRRKEKSFAPRGDEKQNTSKKIYEGEVAAGLLKNSRILPDKNVAEK